jgi:protein-tyrosine sulfotransferase
MEREAFDEIEEALAVCAGQPGTRGGIFRTLAAIIGGVPALDGGSVGEPMAQDALHGVVSALLQAGNIDALNRMTSARAEALVPGLPDALLQALSSMGVDAGDDGEPEYIFIGGAGRSGTTLLRAMLDAHPRIRCGPELKVVPDLCQMRLSWTQSLAPELDAAGADPDVLDHTLRAAISTLLDGAGEKAPRIAEKTPHNLLFMDLLGRVFPRAVFVHVIRDGRAVAASLIRQKWFNPQTSEPLWYCANALNAARYWQDTVNAVRGQVAAVEGRYIEVVYESLVATPGREMTRLLAFLGEPWNDAVLQHERSAVSLPGTETSSAAVSEAVHLRALDKWRDELSPAELAQVIDVAGDTLATLGYVDSGPVEA